MAKIEKESELENMVKPQMARRPFASGKLNMQPSLGARLTEDAGKVEEKMAMIELLGSKEAIDDEKEVVSRWRHVQLIDYSSGRQQPDSQYDEDAGQEQKGAQLNDENLGLVNPVTSLPISSNN